MIQDGVKYTIPELIFVPFLTSTLINSGFNKILTKSGAPSWCPFLNSFNSNITCLCSLHSLLPKIIEKKIQLYSPVKFPARHGLSPQLLQGQAMVLEACQRHT